MTPKAKTFQRFVFITFEFDIKCISTNFLLIHLLNNKGLRTPRQERQTVIQMLNTSLRKDVIVQEAKTKLRSFV